MILPASYQSGFAPRDGRPLYPQLWKSCVFAAAPCLGPPGLTLRDWSGLQRHGILTNMSAESAWGLDGGKYALFFDATNDYVTASNRMTFASGDALSASIWFRATGVGTTRELFNRFNGSGASSSDEGWLISRRSTNKLRFTLAQSGSYSTWESTNTFTETSWYNIVVTHRFGSGASFAMYVNGIAIAGSWTTGTGNQIPDSDGDNYGIVIGAQRYAGVTYDVWQGSVDDARLYNRICTANEAKILASRRGIAYEMATRRRSVFASGFKPAWVRRRSLVIGGGIN